MPRKATTKQRGPAVFDRIYAKDIFHGNAETQQPAGVTFTPAAGGANVCNLLAQVVDGKGNALAGVFHMDIILSDAATGAGLTGTSASGTVQAKAASGVDLAVLTAKKAIRVQTKADGTYTLEITDTGKTGFYPAAYLGSKLSVGSQLVTGNYG